MRAKSALQAGSAASALLWFGALWLPFYTTFHQATYPQQAMDHFRQWPALWLFAVGWCVPLCVNIAWFANVIWAISVWRALRRNRTSAGLAVLGLLLGLTVLLPTLNYDVELGRYDMVWTTGPAVWTWLTALALNTMNQLTFGAKFNTVQSSM